MTAVVQPLGKGLKTASDIQVIEALIESESERMLSNLERLAGGLCSIVSCSTNRTASLQGIAELLKNAGGYRWVGLYDVDREAQIVRNIVWSGPAAPAYPTFPITNGLTGAAISGRRTVNIGDVLADPRYLTAFGTTRSEIVVPVLDPSGEKVVGTIDVESEKPNAFSSDVQTFLENCAELIRPLWRG